MKKAIIENLPEDFLKAAQIHFVYKMPNKGRPYNMDGHSNQVITSDRMNLALESAWTNKQRWESGVIMLIGAGVGKAAELFDDKKKPCGWRYPVIGIGLAWTSKEGVKMCSPAGFDYKEKQVTQKLDALLWLNKFLEGKGLDEDDED